MLIRQLSKIVRNAENSLSSKNTVALCLIDQLLWLILSVTQLKFAACDPLSEN